jgi:glycosyltransferase involved in cell wall biosynthesis
MIIGIDIRTLMDAQYSGVSEYTLNLIKEILKLDNYNEYRLFYNSFGDCPNLPEFNFRNVKPVRYHYPNKVLNYLFFKFFNYPKIDKELEADVFFMPHINFIGLTPNPPQPLPQRVRDRLFAKGGVKKILTIHDLSFLRNPEFFSRRKNFWHKMINVKKLVKRFDRIVAVSENTKRDIVELCGVDENKIKVIYAGAGDEFRKLSKSQIPNPNDQLPMIKQIQNTKYKIQSLNADEKKLLEVRSKYKLPDEFILYLGTIEPRKNVGGIIRAYNELRYKNQELGNVKLVIAGGRGWKFDNIYKEWERSEFRDDIKFLGYVDSEDKVYLYNLASVFIYPSFYEGFGFPPLEAMASGVPVITSYASSLPEVAGEAALLVDPYKIDEIANGLEQTLTNRRLRDNLIKKGLEQASRFSWDKTAGEYLEILNNL